MCNFVHVFCCLLSGELLQECLCKSLTGRLEGQMAEPLEGYLMRYLKLLVEQSLTQLIGKSWGNSHSIVQNSLWMD